MGGSDFHLERTDLDISQMLLKVCQQFRGRMEDKEMELHMDIQPAFHYAGDGRLRKRRGLFSCGGHCYGVAAERNFLCREFRHPHCRGRFEADLHAILPGGQVKKPEQRRQRPWAVYYQDHLGSPWDTARHGEYGGWSAVYGVSALKGNVLLTVQEHLVLSVIPVWHASSNPVVVTSF